MKAASDAAAAAYAEAARLRAELEGYRAERARIKAEESQREQQKLVEKGSIDEVRKHFQAELDKRDQEISRIREERIGSERQRAIAQGFASSGVQLAGSNVQAILAQQWAADFETVEIDGKVVTRDRITGRPPEDVIRERLASKDFAWAVAYQARAGVASGGASSPTSGGVAKTDEQRLVDNLLAARGFEATLGFKPKARTA